MSAIKNFIVNVLTALGKTVVLFIGLCIAFVIAQLTSPQASAWVAGGAAITTLFCIFKPQPRLWIPNRISAGVLAFVALIMLMASGQNINRADDARLAALRAENPQAYIAEIRVKRDQAFLMSELKALDSQAYLAEAKAKGDDGAYMAALADVDPTAHQAEVDRRAAEERAKREAKEAQRLAEIRRLEDEVRQAAKHPAKAQLPLWWKLAGLDPSNAEYSKEIARLEAIVGAEERATELAELRAKLPQAKGMQPREQVVLYARLAELDPKNTVYPRERDRAKAAIAAEDERAAKAIAQGASTPTATLTQHEADEGSAFLINLAGFPCARVLSRGVVDGLLVIQCVEWRDGSGRASYTISREGQVRKR